MTAARLGLFVADINLLFEPNRVVAAGLTPNAETYWFSLAREPQGYYTKVVRREQFVPAGSTRGEASFDLPAGVPRMSVWVVVELTHGQFAVARPGGMSHARVDPRRNGLRPDPQGNLTSFESDRAFSEILLVRPGRGIWRSLVRDGGTADRNGLHDGRVVISPLDLRPVRDTTLQKVIEKRSSVKWFSEGFYMREKMRSCFNFEVVRNSR